MEFSLNDYANRNPLNAIIAKNMVNMDALGDGPGLFEEKACFCFSVAYQICRRLIDESPAQIWILPDLYKKSLYHSGDKDLKSIMQAVTLSIVLIMTEHLPDEWKTKNHELCDEILKKIKNIFVKGETTSLYGGLTMNMRATFGFDTEAVSAYKALRQGTDIDYVLTYEEFNPQGVNIQNSATGNVLMAAMEKRIAESEIKIGSLIPRFEYDQPNKGLKIVQGGYKEIVDFSEKEKEYKKQIDALKTEVESLRAESKKLRNQLDQEQSMRADWYTGEFEKLPEDIKITLRERLVFFTTVLSLDLNKKYTILSNLATFIDELCNDQHNIGPFISKMKRDKETAANAKAAKKITGLLQTIIPEEYRQDTKLTINKIIESIKANFPEEEE